MQGRSMLVEVMVFHRNVMKYIEGTMNPNSGLGVRELFFLFFLEKKGETTYYEMANLLPHNSSYVSKSIKKLEALELISRRKDGIKKIIEIAPKGRALLNWNESAKGDFLNDLVEKGMTLEELATFFETMSKFSRVLEKELGEDLQEKF